MANQPIAVIAIIIKEVIFIAIADYIMFPDKAVYQLNHVILGKVTYKCDLKNFPFTFIELPNFTQRPEDPLNNLLERWYCFFK